MLYINGLRNISDIEELLTCFPYIEKYYHMTPVEKYPVLFVLYAKYRNANLSFGADGSIEGYSELSLDKDILLKEIFLLLKGEDANIPLIGDLNHLWNDLKGCSLNSDYGVGFYAIATDFIYGGNAVSSYAQADTIVSKTVAHELLDCKASNVLELTGRAGLLGDDYLGWERYSAYISNWKERFIEEMMRDWNECKKCDFPENNFLLENNFSVKEFDTIIANFAENGGLGRNEVEPFFDSLLDYHASGLYWKCKKTFVLVDFRFCYGEEFYEIRNRLLFFRCLDSVSIIPLSSGKVAVVAIDFAELHDSVFFRTYIGVSESEDSKSVIVPVSALVANDAVICTEKYVLEKSGFETDKIYKIALVGTPFKNQEELDILSENNLCVSYDVPSFIGKDGIERILKCAESRQTERIDAIIIDSLADYDDSAKLLKHKGIYYANKYASAKLPVYVCANSPVEEVSEYIGEILEYGGYYERENHLFLGNDRMMKLVCELRSKLAVRAGLDASIRATYEKELQIADFFDESGEMSRVIVNGLRDDMLGYVRPQDLINGLRRAAETLFNKSKSIYCNLPPVSTLGQMQQFLQNGFYYDKCDNLEYELLDKNLMHPALAMSFDYFVKMTNGGSHGASECNVDVVGYMASTLRPSICKTCTLILMDILCWYQNLLSRCPECLFRKNKIVEPSDKVCLCRLPDGRKYYYIGKIHLSHKSGLLEGISSRHIKFHRVRLERNKPILAEISHVRYNANEDDYILLR